MLKVPFIGCFGLSQAISSQFTLKMCVAAPNREKSLKTHILKVQVRSRSLILMSIERVHGLYQSLMVT